MFPVNLYTIYSRVQKLGGFNAIADNRVWKNLFEDLSEPGKCVTQGMTKRKYERILLPFERYEREMRENGKQIKSELTISTIPRGMINNSKDQSLNNRKSKKPHHSSSPAIEIIPLKNGATSEHELTLEQINEIHNIIKPKEYENRQYSNDGVSVPVHVIVRPSANSSSMDNSKVFEYERVQGSPWSFSGSQSKPKEKENIPMMLKSTTILPLNRDGVPTFSSSGVVDLVDDSDDDDAGFKKGHQHSKKQKLDILREGGLEVTPISRRDSLPFTHPAPTRSQTMQPNVSLMSLTLMRAPPVIQSPNMYQSTGQVFKNPFSFKYPNEEPVSTAKSQKTCCLDLTSKKQQQNQQVALDTPRDHRKNQLSIEEVQRNYRGSNPDLQITLVKPYQDVPSSSSSGTYSNSKTTPKNRSAPAKKSKNLPQPLPPLNPVIIAAANELQKLQPQNMPLFPFLSGLDITPMQQSGPSNGSSKAAPAPPNAMNASIMSYLSALYSNPLLQNNNLLSNMSHVEFLKNFTLNSSTSNNAIPSSKN